MTKLNCITDCPLLPVLEGVEIRHCPGHLGCAVGNNGSVWSCQPYHNQTKPLAWRPLKRQCTRRGSVIVGVSTIGMNRTQMVVARLVLSIFVGDRSERKFKAAHKDGNRTNNDLSNLEWRLHTYQPNESIAKAPEFPEKEGVAYKHVPNYPGYAAGSDGTAWSCWRFGGRTRGFGPHWRQLRGSSNMGGYLVVRLKDNKGSCGSCFIHHLVLKAFCGPKPDGQECRHLDGNRQNNSLENLRWGTRSENQRDSVLHGTCAGFRRRGDDHPRVMYSEELVRHIRAAAKSISAHRLHKLTGLSYSHTKDIIRGTARCKG